MTVSKPHEWNVGWFAPTTWECKGCGTKLSSLAKPWDVDGRTFVVDVTYAKKEMKDVRPDCEEQKVDRILAG